MNFWCVQKKNVQYIYVWTHREKIHREAHSDICLLGWTIRADIFGLIFLGRKKSSQMAAYVCKSKNEQFSVDINNLFLLVSFYKGMHQGFTCMKNGCYRGKARVLLKKVLAYPFLYLNAFIPIFDQMACHFSNQSSKAKNPFLASTWYIYVTLMFF